MPFLDTNQTDLPDYVLHRALTWITRRAYSNTTNLHEAMVWRFHYHISNGEPVLWEYLWNGNFVTASSAGGRYVASQHLGHMCDYTDFHIFITLEPMEPKVFLYHLSLLCGYVFGEFFGGPVVPMGDLGYFRQRVGFEFLEQADELMAKWFTEGRKHASAQPYSR